MTFGLQNQVITPTPTGRIDSAFLNGADGSNIVPVWNGAPNPLNLTIGTAYSIDLVAARLFTDPGSPASSLGFHTVSGPDPDDAGFVLTGTVLSNNNTVSSSGVFQLVAVRNNISVLSSPISFTISPPAGVDNVPPTVPTGITAAPGTVVGTIAVGFDPPADVGTSVASASGSVHVDILSGSAVLSPPSPITVPANALAAPASVNIGNITSPQTPGFNQNQKVFGLSAAGTGIAATTSEQCLLVDFGLFSSTRQCVALLDKYTGGSATTALAGIMIHETGVAGGKFLAIGLGPSDGTTGLYVISRNTAGAASSQVATQLKDSNGQAITGPVYVKLNRSADLSTITVSYSLTGLGWTLITTLTNAMNAAVHYGPFATSQSSGTDVTANIEEVAITNTGTVNATITSAVQLALQFRSVDAAGNVSALSASIIGVPNTQSSSNIVIIPGHIARTGAGNNSIDPSNLIQLFQFMDNAIAADIHNNFVGFCFPIYWAHLEFAQGVYDSPSTNEGYTLVQAIVNKCKSYNPKRFPMFSLNQTGNGLGVNNGAGFPSFFCPSYLNSSTYAGGAEWAGRSGYSGYPVTNTTFWNANTAQRVVNMIQAYYNQFGPYDPTTGNGIYMWELTNEISMAAQSAFTGTEFLATVQNIYSQVRTVAPRQMFSMRPTFINPAPPNASFYGPLCTAMVNAKICMGCEDGTNFVDPPGHTGMHYQDWGTQAYRGLFGGIPDRSQNNTWAFVFNVENAEYGNPGFPLNAVPPASKGTGYLNDGTTWPGIMNGANLCKAIHVIWFLDGQQGPPVNRFAFPNASAPANPTPGPGAGSQLVRPHLVDAITGNTAYSGITAPIQIPNITRPQGW